MKYLYAIKILTTSLIQVKYHIFLGIYIVIVSFILVPKKTGRPYPSKVLKFCMNLRLNIFVSVKIPTTLLIQVN